MALTNEQDFFILLLEEYAEYKDKSASQILSIWKENNLISYINEMYDLYHIERLENAFEDIDEKLAM